MASKICILLTGILFYSSVRSQRLLDKEIASLHNTIERFLEKSDKYYEMRKPEIIFLILEIDSSGSVSDIHLLGDKENLDSTYPILKRIKAENFIAGQYIKWKNKVLSLPVYSLTGIDYDSIRKRSFTYIERSIIHHSTPFESRTSVMLRPLYYLPPAIQTTEY